MKHPSGSLPIPCAFALLLVASSCGPAKGSSAKDARPVPHWDPSSNYPALSSLFSAALGTPVKIKACGDSENILADGTNAMATVALDERGPLDGSPMGRLWLRPPLDGGVPVPARIQAWFAVARPAVVKSTDRIVLRIPGGQSREVVRVGYLPTPDSRDDASSDRRWWRLGLRSCQ